MFLQCQVVLPLMLHPVLLPLHYRWSPDRRHLKWVYISSRPGRSQGLLYKHHCLLLPWWSYIRKGLLPTGLPCQVDSTSYRNSQKRHTTQRNMTQSHYDTKPLRHKAITTQSQYDRKPLRYKAITTQSHLDTKSLTRKVTKTKRNLGTTYQNDTTPLFTKV